MAHNDEDILIVGECDCGCGCNEVELHSDHQPDVLLFDEYAEPYENDILRIREIAEEWQEEGTREEKATENKQEILNEIQSALASLQGGDTTATLSALKAAIEHIEIDTSGLAKESSVSRNGLTTIDILLDVATDQEIYDMFTGEVIDEGYVSVDFTISEDNYLVANYTIENGLIIFN